MTGYARGEPEFAADRYRRDARPSSLASKDYSVPLHVDCSIEYELPDCAKPPQGVKIEPLLMIHPSHFRRLESLRRVPFVNNLPRAGADAALAAAAAVTPDARRRRRCCRAAPAPPAPLPQPQPAQGARDPHPLPAPPAHKPEYRFEAFSLGGGGGGKMPSSVVRRRAVPYSEMRAALALGCEAAAMLPAAYDRFDKRALQQLPIFM